MFVTASHLRLRQRLVRHRLYSISSRPPRPRRLQIVGELLGSFRTSPCDVVRTYKVLPWWLTFLFDFSQDKKLEQEELRLEATVVYHQHRNVDAVFSRNVC